MSAIRIASIPRAFPTLRVMTRSIVFGQWAAHPTGRHVDHVTGDEGEQSVLVFDEWGITHVPSGRAPVTTRELAWHEAVAIAQALDEAYPEGVDPRKAEGGKARFDALIDAAVAAVDAGASS